MIFISLNKLKKMPTKGMLAEVSKITEEMAKDGVKVLANYWTLGRYDTVWLYEAPDEKTYMKALMRQGDMVATETLVAVPRAEAVKMVE